MPKPFLSATKFVVEINRAQLLKDITFKNSRATTMELRKELAPKIEEAQKKLVRDFSSHAVTRELQSGPNAPNISGSLNGYGNLFSFIGFDSGQNPTDVIQALLSDKMRFKVRAVSSGRFKVTVFVPTKEEVFAITPLPWASGSSWAEGVEKGISNLGSYLYSSAGFSRSNSGTGIQIKNSKKSVTFKETPYISALFDGLKKSLQRLDK